MDLNFLRGAVREGLNTLNPKPNLGEDLEIYEQLQPSDFPKLIEKYGECDSRAKTDLTQSVDQRFAMLMHETKKLSPNNR